MPLAGRRPYPDPVPGVSALEGLRTVLAGRDFRRLLATRLVSQAGDGAFEVGLATLVFFSAEHATSAAVAASAFAVAILPYTLVGPFAGVLLDRWRRRQVLLVANLARTLLAVVVALLVVRSGIGLALSLLVLLCLSVNRFFLAGLGASLPHVVRRDELVVANAIAPTSGTVAALLGAAVGYGVRHRAGGGDASNALVVLVAAARVPGRCTAHAADGPRPARAGPGRWFPRGRRPPRAHRRPPGDRRRAGGGRPARPVPATGPERLPGHRACTGSPSGWRRWRRSWSAATG